MPNVKPGENRKDFVARCVPVVLDEGTAKNGPQAAAICNSMWRDHMQKKSAAKAGARNSGSDQKRLNDAHDAVMQAHEHLVSAGAKCPGGSCMAVNEDMEAQVSKSAIKAMQDMGPVEYAIHEGWDIQQCCAVCSQLAAMCQDECLEGEMDEAMTLCEILMALMKHCEGECQEMMDSLQAAPPGGEAESEGEMMTAKVLSLNYVKALNIPRDEQFLRDVVAIKSKGGDNITGYLTLWGNPQIADIEIEYFTGASQKSAPNPPTDFWDARIALPRPLTWNHGLDRAIVKSTELIGEIVEYWDDEIGRAYNAILDRSHKYRKLVDRIISERRVGTSSDSAPQYTIREKKSGSKVWIQEGGSGPWVCGDEERKNIKGAAWIKQWPLWAASLTDIPAEPRMLDVGSPYWKSIGIDPARARTGAGGLDRPGAVHIPEELRIQAQLVKRAAGLTWKT